jgi:hypothetical protein
VEGALCLISNKEQVIRIIRAIQGLKRRLLLIWLEYVEFHPEVNLYLFCRVSCFETQDVNLDVIDPLGVIELFEDLDLFLSFIFGLFMMNELLVPVSDELKSVLPRHL